VREKAVLLPGQPVAFGSSGSAAYSAWGASEGSP
jgi:hypothetical protein